MFFLKKKQNSDTACWVTEETKFRTKTIHFEKSHNAEKTGGENLRVPKSWKTGTLLHCNGFVFHVRGFQNQVLSTFVKSAQCRKSDTYRVRYLDSHCNSQAHFSRKAPT